MDFNLPPQDYVMGLYALCSTVERALIVQAFLLNHSVEYCGAMAAAMVEYAIESYFFPGLKRLWLIVSCAGLCLACLLLIRCSLVCCCLTRQTLVGFLLTAAGSGVRVMALFTAKHNFTHEIADEKKPEHVLVTNGIYQYVRHPGYAGWFWWTVGTQVMLVNPVCILAFAYAAWRFFRDRIPYEEEGLVSFFGQAYITYRAKTPTCTPQSRGQCAFAHAIHRYSFDQVKGSLECGSVHYR